MAEALLQLRLFTRSFRMKPIKLNREKELEVMLTLCVAFVMLWWVTNKVHIWMLGTALAVGFIGMFSKYLTSKIAFGWMKMAEMMGGIMNKVMLSLIFFLFLVPIAILSRILSRSKSSLLLKKPDTNTYFFDRKQRYTAKDFENTW